MTANRDAQSIEDRKARYSRELAAYTLRQWDLVRQAMESGSAGADNSSQRERSSSVPRESDRSSRVHSSGSRSDWPMSLGADVLSTHRRSRSRLRAEPAPTNERRAHRHRWQRLALRGRGAHHSCLWVSHGTERVLATDTPPEMSSPLRNAYL